MIAPIAKMSIGALYIGSLKRISGDFHLGAKLMLHSLYIIIYYISLPVYCILYNIIYHYIHISIIIYHYTFTINYNCNLFARYCQICFADLVKVLSASLILVQPTFQDTI